MITKDEVKKITYSEYLNSNHWLDFRDKAIANVQFECEECGWQHDDFAPLNVHHLNYDNLGNETMDDVLVLCYRCHMEAHGH